MNSAMAIRALITPAGERETMTRVWCRSGESNSNSPKGKILPEMGIAIIVTAILALTLFGFASCDPVTSGHAYAVEAVR